MKHVLKKALWVLLPGIFAVLGSCSDDKTETVAPPVVSFPVTDAEMEVDVEEEITFEAVVENDEEAGCIWYVNGVAAASTPTMTYAFTQVGLYTVRCEVYNDGGRVAKVYKVKVNGIPLEVEFSDSGDEVSCDQGDEVRISATVVGGDKEVKHSWSIDGTVVSETADFIHTFMEPGTFTLAYAGVNAYRMTATKGWTVRVAEVELPLTIEFSPVPGAIGSHRGDEVVISTSVKGGAEGLVHEWKVDGAVVSSDAEFRRVFSELGTFSISYTGVNAKQERVEKTWSLLVSHSVEDLEEAAALPSVLVDQNKSISVVENPHVTAVNGSAKVLKSDMSSSSNPTSGRFWLDLSGMSDLASYSAVRVKVWIGTNSYVPYMQLLNQGINRRPTTLNGQRYTTEDEWRQIVRTDEWNVLVYDLPETFGKENLDGVATLDFRPMSNFDGSNAPAENNDRILYYDDFEFLK